MTMEWNEETQLLIAGKDTDMIDDIQTGMIMRARANKLKAEVKVMETEANDLIKAALIVTGIKETVTLDGVGAVTFKDPYERKSLDQKKCKLGLVERGVDAGLVAEVFEAAQKVSQVAESVMFKGVKL